MSPVASHTPPAYSQFEPLLDETSSRVAQEDWDLVGSSSYMPQPPVAAASASATAPSSTIAGQPALRHPALNGTYFKPRPLGPQDLSHAFANPRRIYIVRHGEAWGNVDETVFERIPDSQVPVTPKGYQQARKAGALLRSLIGSESVELFCSPYRRALQTAEAITTELSLGTGRTAPIPVHEDPRLREQDFGNLQRMADIVKCRREREYLGAFFYRFPQGESGSDAYNRLADFQHTFCDAIATAHASGTAPPANVVIVTHGMALRLFLMSYYRWSVSTFHKLWNPINCKVAVMERVPEGGPMWETEEGHFPYRLLTPLRQDDASPPSGEATLERIYHRGWGDPLGGISYSALSAEQKADVIKSQGLHWSPSLSPAGAAALAAAQATIAAAERDGNKGAAAAAAAAAVAQLPAGASVHSGKRGASTPTSGAQSAAAALLGRFALFETKTSSEHEPYENTFAGRAHAELKRMLQLVEDERRTLAEQHRAESSSSASASAAAAAADAAAAAAANTTTATAAAADATAGATSLGDGNAAVEIAATKAAAAVSGAGAAGASCARSGVMTGEAQATSSGSKGAAPCDIVDGLAVGLRPAGLAAGASTPQSSASPSSQPASSSGAGAAVPAVAPPAKSRLISSFLSSFLSPPTDTSTPPTTDAASATTQTRTPGAGASRERDQEKR